MVTGTSERTWWPADVHGRDHAPDLRIRGPGWTSQNGCGRVLRRSSNPATARRRRHSRRSEACGVSPKCCPDASGHRNGHGNPPASGYSGSPITSAATRAAAIACMSRSTWEYVSSVIDTLACRGVPGRCEGAPRSGPTSHVCAGGRATGSWEARAGARAGRSSRRTSWDAAVGRPRGSRRGHHPGTRTSGQPLPRRRTQPSQQHTVVSDGYPWPTAAWRATLQT